jgi:DNA-binding GntR family transcriptional regulator
MAGSAAVGVGDGRGSAPEQVLQWLRDAILDGQLPSGTRLKINDLAAELGVSHMPVREALHLLVMEGLALRLPRRGVLVRALSAEDVTSAYEVLGSLEGLAARWVAEHMTAARAESFRRLLAAEPALVEADDRDALRQINLAFHGTIQDLYPSNWAATFVRQLRNYTYRVRRAFPQSQARLQAVAEEHQALLAVLALGDAGGAERLARMHSERACREVVQQLQSAAKSAAKGAAGGPVVTGSPRRGARPPSSGTPGTVAWPAAPPFGR